MQPLVDDVVAETLQYLVNHYSQEVQIVEESPPYFDPLLGSSPPNSVVLKKCFGRLSSLPNLTLSKWLAGYATSIAPLLSERSIGCIQILQDYELVIANWIDHIGDSCQCEITQVPYHQQLLYKALHSLTNDLTMASTGQNNPQISDYVRCNILLPTLLRILSHTIRFSSLLCQENGFTIIKNSIVLKCAIAALPFLNAKLDPRVLCAPFVKEEATKSFFQFCYCPPPDSLLKHISCQISFARIDWASATLDSTNIFNDPRTGIVARVADQVWGSLSKLCQVQSFRDPSCADTSSSIGICPDKRSKIQFLRRIGIGTVARALRDQFFCTGSGGIPNAQPTCVDFMRKRAEKQQQNSTEAKAFEEEPIRIHAALNFISLVTNEDACSSNDVVAALVPVILELLQSTNAVYASMGACVTIYLLFVLDRQSLIWKEMGGQILAKLEIASRTHQEVPITILIGRAQYEIVRTVGQSPQQRRHLCRQWIIRLCQSTRSSKSNNECWALLCAGVVPLLHLLASEGECDGIEIGRVGLQALLPLVRRHIVDATIHTNILALIALINLLCSASAMMPSHGGKIICHLLSSPDAVSGEAEKIREMRELYNYTAAVCLVVCGAHADNILTKIMLLEEEYKKDFVTRLTDVRKFAADLRKTHMKLS